VLVNESEIFQIVLNLCINANDALGGAPGRVVISLSHGDAGEPGDERGTRSRVTGGRFAPDRTYVCLAVTDDGTGMDQETLSRIFEPFFTTKERGRGTGLGLAVVYGIIAAHDGAYVVESGRGAGTSFRVYLPLDTRAPTKRVLDAVSADPRGRENVLVIDDDGDLLEMMTSGLERFGYEVTGTDDPSDALESVIADPGVWDVVVSDHVMPGMMGLTLLTEIKRVRPDCPVILCTGFSDNLTEAQARALGVDAFFLKPVQPVAIACQIRALLDR
jgi:two-component system cell cycle sensor histidine kinase/response regulator CckA